MKRILMVTVSVALTAVAAGASPHKAPALGADAALQRLVAGNKRYVAGKPQRPDQSPRRRQEVAKAQHPFAVVLTCSDSRVPPELLFDQGIGDLFVVRTAGNVVDDVALGSIEYAVEHLSVPLVVVLGHERCGAVGAAVEGGEAPGHIKALIEPILPAVEKARAMGGDLADHAARANVGMVAAKVGSSEPILRKLAAEKKLKVVGMRYDLDTGAVTPVPYPK